MLNLAASSPIVIWSAIWKICAAALVGGAGVAIVFGFVIMGIENAQKPNASGGTKALNYSMATLAGAFCIFAIVVGIWAMTKKS
jgi:preprotein translocase subunit SecG